MQILKLVTHWDHQIHPNILEAGKEKNLPCWKKVAGIALFIFTCIATVGILPIFWAVKAKKKLHPSLKPFPLIELPMLTETQKKMCDHFIEVEKAYWEDKKKETFEIIDSHCWDQKQTKTTETYDLDKTVSTIKELMKTKKVALFIGRDADEFLPDEKEFHWISLDMQSSKAWEKDRLHLQVDLNKDLEKIKKIQGLFHKVVVDLSTMKFLTCRKDFGWEGLQSLLKKEKEAVLIAEFSAPGGTIPISPNCKFTPLLKLPEEVVKHLKGNWEKSSERDKPFSSYLLEISIFEECSDFMKRQEEEQLAKVRTLFDEVEYHAEKLFPYASRWRGATSSFFILKGPKLLPPPDIK